MRFSIGRWNSGGGEAGADSGGMYRCLRSIKHGRARDRGGSKRSSG